MAQAAYARVAAHTRVSDEYRSFSREFPTLVHTCGLAQAVAFALAKKDTKKPDNGPQYSYAHDLGQVLGFSNPEQLAKETRHANVSGYLRLSRDALAAAVWLKRYVEALAEDGGKTSTALQTQGA
jgi:CRISPR-associated protein Cmr5